MRRWSMASPQNNTLGCQAETRARASPRLTTPICCIIQIAQPPKRRAEIAYPSGGNTHMFRNNLIAWMLTVCFIALIPAAATAKTGDVKATMSRCQTATTKRGAAKVQGSDLYFGDTKVSNNDLVRAVKKEHGAAASIFIKSGDQYTRVATTVKKEDGSNAVGTALDAKSPAIAKLNSGEPYYGDATVFGKTYDAGYEPIKDASGAVIGGYFVGYKK